MATPHKRIVIQEGDLHRIIGFVDGTPPEVIQPYEGGLEAPFSLVQVKTRYALYRQALIPASGRFGEFHPEQR